MLDLPFGGASFDVILEKGTYQDSDCLSRNGAMVNV